MPCCSCNGKRALCRGCSCAKGGKGCTGCYPGRKGKCVNALIAAPQTSSQQLPRVLAPSYSPAEHASQPSLPTPPQPLEHDSPVPTTQLPPTPSPLSPSEQLQYTQANEQQLFSPDYLPSPESGTALPSEEPPSSAMPSCCKCKGDNARCVSCKCCKENRACVNCLPGRRGKCVNILNVLSRTSPPAIEPKPNQAANTVQEVDKPGQHRQRCVVHGCKELIAPSMWKNHLNLHTQSILPGSVPEDWLGQNNMVICSYCFHLVASSHLQSHHGKCPLKTASTGVQLSQDSSSNADATTQLPSFEDVCLLHCSTIRHIPIKSRPAFAGVLSAAFHSILHENSEEAWLKFFMLPKCVLVALKRRGRHRKPLPINHLCDLWSKGQFGFLWEHASQQVTSKTRQAHTSGSDHNIRLAIGLAKEGLYGKACQILTSSGVAPNNDTTWQLLQAKHPKGPPPVCPPNDTSNFPSILPNTFDILSVLRSFTKSTACGPSGLRVQHLLDAAEVPMQSSIC